MYPNPDLTYIIIMGTFGTLLIAVSLVLFVVSYQKKNLRNKLNLLRLETRHRQELTEVSFQGQEKERLRIAKDLHDDIGSLLSAVKLQMGLIKIKSRQAPEMTGLIEESIETVSATIGEVRSISRNLRPYLLDTLGFSKAVEYLVGRVGNPPGFVASFRETGSPLPLSEKKQINLYRSVQELINNAIRHSGAASLDVFMSWQDNSLEIEVRDNGSGFDYSKVQQTSNGGFGLKNISSRLDIAEAKMDIRSSAAGTTVLIRTPVT